MQLLHLHLFFKCIIISVIYVYPCVCVCVCETVLLTVLESNVFTRIVILVYFLHCGTM